MIVFYAIGEREKAKELVRIVTKTRWKTISKYAVKVSSSSLGPTVIIFRPTMAGLAVALWLKQRADELHMMSAVGWFQPVENYPDKVKKAAEGGLKRGIMASLDVPWSP